MATTSITETAITPNATAAATNTPAIKTPEHKQVYGCIHIENILQKHGERVRQEYDSIMSVVIQPSSASKAGRVKV